MSLSTEEQFWYATYAALPVRKSKVVDDAFGDVRARLADAGLPFAGGDHAARLVAAITRYLVEAEE